MTEAFKMPAGTVVRVEFETILPVPATWDEVEEWVRLELGAGSMDTANPLSSHGLNDVRDVQLDGGREVVRRYPVGVRKVPGPDNRVQWNTRTQYAKVMEAHTLPPEPTMWMAGSPEAVAEDRYSVGPSDYMAGVVRQMADGDVLVGKAADGTVVFRERGGEPWEPGQA